MMRKTWPTFVDAPQPGVGAHVLKVAHVRRIRLYDVPILGSEGSGQKSEAQHAADAGCDHQEAKGYLHPAQVRGELARNGDGFTSCVTRTFLVLIRSSKRWRAHYGMRKQKKSPKHWWGYPKDLQRRWKRTCPGTNESSHKARGWRSDGTAAAAAASDWEGLGFYWWGAYIYARHGGGQGCWNMGSQLRFNKMKSE